MRISVDLDDVLADLIARLIDTHRQLTGESLTRDEVVKWDVFPPEVHDHVRYNGGYVDLKPLPFATEFLGWLAERGDQACIVTYRGEHARKMTEAWLREHMPGLWSSVHFTGGSKIEACRELGVGLIVDDSYNQIPAVTDALGIPGVLMDTPMNRHIAETPMVRRASDLREAQAIITKLEAEGRL